MNLWNFLLLYKLSVQTPPEDGVKSTTDSQSRLFCFFQTHYHKKRGLWDYSFPWSLIPDPQPYILKKLQKRSLFKCLVLGGGVSDKWSMHCCVGDTLSNNVAVLVSCGSFRGLLKRLKSLKRGLSSIVECLEVYVSFVLVGLYALQRWRHSLPDLFIYDLCGNEYCFNDCK